MKSFNITLAMINTISEIPISLEQARLQNDSETEKSLVQQASPTKKKIKWIPFLFIWGMHVGALAAFFTFTWKALILCFVLHWVTGGLGITL